MKHLIIALAALTSLTASAQLGVDAMAKQQARNAANQSANRSLEVPGATSTAPATRPSAAPAVSSTPLTPAQQAYSNFQTDLFKVTNAAPDGVKASLAKDLASVAQGANKPSQATVSKLSEHLTTAWGEAKLTPVRKGRVAQEVGVLLNSANTPDAQKQAMIKDVQSILQSGGASSDNAAAVGADLQVVASEVKPK
jgi:hypothetical protein